LESCKAGRKVEPEEIPEGIPNEPENVSNEPIDLDALGVEI